MGHQYGTSKEQSSCAFHPASNTRIPFYSLFSPHPLPTGFVPLIPSLEVLGVQQAAWLARNFRALLLGEGGALLFGRRLGAKALVLWWWPLAPPCFGGFTLASLFWLVSRGVKVSKYQSHRKPTRKIRGGHGSKQCLHTNTPELGTRGLRPVSRAAAPPAAAPEC